MNYHVRQENLSAATLTEATVTFGTFAPLPGILPPTVTRDFLFVGEDHPLPEQALVKWTTPDGKQHSQAVTVKSLVPKNAHLVTIVFSIDGSDQVRVSVRASSR